MFIFVVFGLLCSNVNGSIVVAEVTLIFLGLMASLLCYQRASVGGCYGWWLSAHADLSGSHGVIVMPSERECAGLYAGTVSRSKYIWICYYYGHNLCM